MSFWSLTSSSDGASMWKQLLKLRTMAKPFVSCALGNGLSCSFWYDKWTPFGDLLSYLGPDAHTLMGIPLHATVASIATNEGWSIANARTPHMEQFLTYLTTVEKTSDPDEYLWQNSSDTPTNRFVFAETWSLCRVQGQDVPWYNQVWFSGAVQKCAFSVWFACLDRLPTLARLRSWAVVDEDVCYLCEIFTETRDHLLLRCPYTFDVWRWAFAKLQSHFRGFQSWNSLLLWMRDYSPGSSQLQISGSSLGKVVAQEVIYAIWRERNARAFTNIRTHVERLISGLDKRIRNVCSARKDHPKFSCSRLLWFRDPVHY